MENKNLDLQQPVCVDVHMLTHLCSLLPRPSNIVTVQLAIKSVHLPHVNIAHR